jgi:periplasmic protein TonB
MFEDSLVESSGTLSRRNPWTIAFSFTFQMLVAGILVLLPLIYTQALPKQQLVSFLEAPAPPLGPALKPVSKAAPTKQASELDDGVLRPPVAIPKKIAIVNEEEASATGSTEVPGSIPGGLPGGVPNSVIDSIVRDIPVAVPKVAVQKVRVSSGVAQGLLIHQVTPQYPTLARQARIQGTVVLQAVIGKDGTVQNLHVLSGHPMLIPAAMDAVRQWRYKPYYLNWEPVEVDTQISVNFTLSGG